MNSYDFSFCRAFLERMIEERPDNNELVKSYTRLIEKKADFDISWSQHGADVQKNWENAQKELTLSAHKQWKGSGVV